MRAFLTLFGLTWGTTAIMLMLAIGEANKNMMIKQMSYLGENTVSLRPGHTTMTFKGLGKYRRIKFDIEDVDRLKSLSCIDTAGGQVNTGNINMRYKNKEAAFDLAGIQPTWAALRNVLVNDDGRGINQSDVIKKRRVAVLGNKIKDTLFGKEKAVGKNIFIKNSPYLIVGVLKPKYEATFFKEMHEDTAFIPITTFMTMFNYNYIESIVYKPKNIAENKQTLSTVTHFFARLKSFNPDDKNAIRIWDMADSSDFINNFTLGLQVFMGIVGVFTMIVAAVGVANIMNVIVEERTKEIGIKMALGIKRRAVMFQFIFESFLFIIIGGVFGFIISKIICAGLKIAHIKGMGEPEVTLYVALITTIVLGMAAFWAGFFPAKRASQLDPVEALRWQ